MSHKPVEGPFGLEGLQTLGLDKLLNFGKGFKYHYGTYIDPKVMIW